MTWSATLARTVKPRDHAALRTLADARSYFLELPAGLARQQSWQQAGKLLLSAAEALNDAAINDATRQLELALFVTGRQDMAEI
jgi:hypothetical protein